MYKQNLSRHLSLKLFENNQTKPSGNRKRKAVSFNPPYNAEVKKKNIGKVFLKLVQKHFHKRHHY